MTRVRRFKKKKTYVQFFLICLACVLAGCSRANMMLINEKANPSFKVSGTNTVMFFQVESERSGVIWRLYPNSDQASLNDIGVVNYGETPVSCHQDFPQGAPPLLNEGELYIASAAIFDDRPVSVEFTIRNGKAVVHPWVESKYSGSSRP